MYISLSEISEHLAYQKDVKPIKFALQQINPSFLASLQTAYTTAQNCLLLARRRTYIVYYLEATIPTVLLAGDVETTKFRRPDIKKFSGHS
ncbi:hypothetical protein [Peribacillus butanolivorans]|uniref:hypothetical protein n=1 Tax=Peribacillus butanolivorans TaxID=421767 RepID=UPI003820C23B